MAAAGPGNFASAAQRMTPTPPDTGAPQPIQAGTLEARLAASAAEVEAAQSLRYRIFYEEMNAVSAVSAADGRVQAVDADRFDSVCDHLLVIDHSRSDRPHGVVGTYRLLRSDCAARAGGFYTAGEYDIACLLKVPGRLLELGRSCVDVEYRNRPTMQLLWQAIAEYVFHYDITLMFGCASLPGRKPEDLALPLSYLYHRHLAPADLRPTALAGRYVDMRLVAPDGIDRKRARAALPPLLKGYLRLGAYVGDGAVIDTAFNTTDVCIVVKTDRVTEKYYRHYQRSTRRAGRD
jgi:putative hemolysin